MTDIGNALESLRLISDWAKWLIIIETAAIAAIGFAFKQRDAKLSMSSKSLATFSVGSFVVSIAAAAFRCFLCQRSRKTLQFDTNIWMTGNGVVGRFSGMNAKASAITESVFFCLGVVCFAALIVPRLWSAYPKGK